MHEHQDIDFQPRRLLVITFHFPPDGSVGGWRWGGISKFLARRGWDVHVITASPQTNPRQAPGLFIQYCPASRTPNDLYIAWAGRVKAARQHAKSIGEVPAPTAVKDGSPNEPGHRGGVIGSIRRNLAAALAFPDYAQGWILPAARAARAQMNKRPFDVVITSGPPHSAHLAGTLACMGRADRLWVDMRDPWAPPIDKSSSEAVYSSVATRSVVQRLERFVLRRARGVVTNTAEFATDLRARYPGIAVTCVPNGIDPERLPPPAAKFDEFSIAYAGTLYLSRDLSPVVRAMRDFLTQCPAARGKMKLRVAGDMVAGLEARFRTEVESCGLEAMVEARGRVPSSEAMDMMNRSHLALVLAQDQPTQVPAKLYECVALGIPTLVIGESTSAAAREAWRIGAMVCDAADLDGIRSVIEQTWSERRPPGKPAVDIGYEAIAREVELLLCGDA